MKRGSIVLFDPDPTVGHEQSKIRPAVLLSDPIAEQRFAAMVAVIPLSTAPSLSPAFYPTLTARPGGLTRDSVVLTDQVRSIDRRRIQKLIGSVTAAELVAIELALRRFLRLP